eukprot:scaffold92907_cov63-Phaeocystis_antarctica.AAC.6
MPSCRPRGRAPRRCYGSPAPPAPPPARTRVSPEDRSALARVLEEPAVVGLEVLRVGLTRHVGELALALAAQPI